MSRRRRALVFLGVLILSALLAFPLRTAVYGMLILPVAYLLWLLGLFYHSLPQIVWWILSAILILYMFVKSIIPDIEFVRKHVSYSNPPKGQVEELSSWMYKAESGVYNRWLVANRLGKLAYQILVQRESGRNRSFFEPLDGPDWKAPPKLTSYLHAGLQGSFADYPIRNNPFAPSAKTPLDHDVSEAVEFLETKVDTLSDNHF